MAGTATLHARRSQPRDDDAVRRLAGLEARVAVLEARGAALEAAVRALRAARLSRANRTALGAILPAVAGVFGSREILTAEILTSESPGLRFVLAGWESAARLGILFRKASGTPIAGFMVERMGSEANAALWRVVAVPDDDPSGASGTAPVADFSTVSSRPEDLE